MSKAKRSPKSCYVVEFGHRGGAHVDNMIFDVRKDALLFCARMVMILTDNPNHPCASQTNWSFASGDKRLYWADENHFVSVSRSEGCLGPASAQLWRKDFVASEKEVVRI